MQAHFLAVFLSSLTLLSAPLQPGYSLSVPVRAVRPRTTLGSGERNSRGWNISPKDLVKREDLPPLRAWCSREDAVNSGIFGNVAFRYKVGLIGFKDTGYCGKGFLDNLHVECKGSWPQYWECTDKGGGYGIEVTWVFPKVQIYRCVENAIRNAGDQKVPWVDCGGADPVDSPVGTGVQVVTTGAGMGGVGGIAKGIGEGIGEGLKKAGAAAAGDAKPPTPPPPPPPPPPSSPAEPPGPPPNSPASPGKPPGPPPNSPASPAKPPDPLPNPPASPPPASPPPPPDVNKSLPPLPLFANLLKDAAAAARKPSPALDPGKPPGAPPGPPAPGPAQPPILPPPAAPGAPRDPSPALAPGRPPKPPPPPPAAGPAHPAPAPAGRSADGPSIPPGAQPPAPPVQGRPI